MIKTIQGDMSLGTGLAGMTFALPSAFVFAGALGLITRRGRTCLEHRKGLCVRLLG
jgi:hypothetical protein